jgi:hypothetical protein
MEYTHFVQGVEQNLQGYPLIRCDVGDGQESSFKSDDHLVGALHYLVIPSTIYL